MKTHTYLHDQFNKAAFWVRRNWGPQPNCFHILAFPRGGSTIIAEAIASAYKAPIIWEPFDRGTKSPQLIDNTPMWGWQEYVPIDFDSSTMDRYFESLQDGEWRDPKLFRKQSLARIAFSRNVIVKHCFSHNSMPYLQKKYGLKILCINRHPGQIIASRQHYNNFLHTNTSYTADNAQSKHSRELLRTHIEKQDKYIKSSYGVTAWKYCVNQLALKNLSKSNTLHIHYDDIVTSPDETSRKLSQWYDCHISPQLFSRQSSTTLGVRSTEKRINGWKSALDKTHIREIESICNDVFNLDIPF